MGKGSVRRKRGSIPPASPTPRAPSCTSSKSNHSDGVSTRPLHPEASTVLRVSTISRAAKEAHETNAAALEKGISSLEPYLRLLQNMSLSSKSRNSSNAQDGSSIINPNLRDFSSENVLSVMSDVIDERSRPSLEYVLGVLGAETVPEGLQERQRNLGAQAFLSSLRARLPRKKPTPPSVTNDNLASLSSRKEPILESTTKNRKHQIGADEKIGMKGSKEETLRTGLQNARRAATNAPLLSQPQSVSGGEPVNVSSTRSPENSLPSLARLPEETSQPSNVDKPVTKKFLLAGEDQNSKLAALSSKPDAVPNLIESGSHGSDSLAANENSNKVKFYTEKQSPVVLNQEIERPSLKKVLDTDEALDSQTTKHHSNDTVPFHPRFAPSGSIDQVESPNPRPEPEQQIGPEQMEGNIWDSGTRDSKMHKPAEKADLRQKGPKLGDSALSESDFTRQRVGRLNPRSNKHGELPKVSSTTRPGFRKPRSCTDPTGQSISEKSPSAKNLKRFEQISPAPGKLEGSQIRSEDDVKQDGLNSVKSAFIDPGRKASRPRDVHIEAKQLTEDNPREHLSNLRPMSGNSVIIDSDGRKPYLERGALNPAHSNLQSSSEFTAKSKVFKQMPTSATETVNPATASIKEKISEARTPAKDFGDKKREFSQDVVFAQGKDSLKHGSVEIGRLQTDQMVGFYDEQIKATPTTPKDDGHLTDQKLSRTGDPLISHFQKHLSKSALSDRTERLVERESISDESKAQVSDDRSREAVHEHASLIPKKSVLQSRPLDASRDSIGGGNLDASQRVKNRNSLSETALRPLLPASTAKARISRFHHSKDVRGSSSTAGLSLTDHINAQNIAQSSGRDGSKGNYDCEKVAISTVPVNISHGDVQKNRGSDVNSAKSPSKGIKPVEILKVPTMREAQMTPNNVKNVNISKSFVPDVRLPGPSESAIEGRTAADFDTSQSGVATGRRRASKFGDAPDIHGGDSCRVSRLKSTSSVFDSDMSRNTKEIPGIRSISMRAVNDPNTSSTTPTRSDVNLKAGSKSSHLLPVMGTNNNTLSRKLRQLEINQKALIGCDKNKLKDLNSAIHLTPVFRKSHIHSVDGTMACKPFKADIEDTLRAEGKPQAPIVAPPPIGRKEASRESSSDVMLKEQSSVRQNRSASVRDPGREKVLEKNSSQFGSNSLLDPSISPHRSPRLLKNAQVKKEDLSFENATVNVKKNIAKNNPPREKILGTSREEKSSTTSGDCMKLRKGDNRLSKALRKDFGIPKSGGMNKGTDATITNIFPSKQSGRHVFDEGSVNDSKQHLHNDGQVMVGTATPSYPREANQSGEKHLELYASKGSHRSAEGEGAQLMRQAKIDKPISVEAKSLDISKTAKSISVKIDTGLKGRVPQGARLRTQETAGHEAGSMLSIVPNSNTSANPVMKTTVGVETAEKERQVKSRATKAISKTQSSAEVNESSDSVQGAEMHRESTICKTEAADEPGTDDIEVHELEDIFGEDDTSSKDSELNPIGKTTIRKSKLEEIGPVVSTVGPESTNTRLGKEARTRDNIKISETVNEVREEKDVEKMVSKRGMAKRGRGGSRGNIEDRTLGTRRLRRESTNLRDAWAQVMPGDVLFDGDELMQECVAVWTKVNQAKISIPFRDPVQAKDAPHYFDIVREPMDLSTVRRHLEEKKIDNPRKFYKQMMRICHNAMLYNDVESDIYGLALELCLLIRKSTRPLVRKWMSQKQSEGDGEPSGSSLSSWSGGDNNDKDDGMEDSAQIKVGGSNKGASRASTTDEVERIARKRKTKVVTEDESESKGVEEEDEDDRNRVGSGRRGRANAKKRRGGTERSSIRGRGGKRREGREEVVVIVGRVRGSGRGGRRGGRGLRRGGTVATGDGEMRGSRKGQKRGRAESSEGRVVGDDSGVVQASKRRRVSSKRRRDSEDA